MAAGKEIRTKIKSVENTRKITRAMEMVAAAKMRKAQERMKHARPYAEKIGRVAAHFSQAHPEYRHPFVVSRETTKRVGLILVTTDKGLCGALNTNALRNSVARMKEWDAKGVGIDITVVGNKGVGFMQRLGANIVSQAAGMGDSPHLEKLIGPVQIMLEAYKEGRIDALYIIYSRFINTMKQESQFKQLLPLSNAAALEKTEHHWDYIYEPEARSVVDSMMVRYIEALIYPGGR
jgi:F-type H+-transporting ATPase subunit gamma